MRLKHLNIIRCTSNDNYLFLLTRSKRISLFHFGTFMLGEFDLASFITYFNGFILQISLLILMIFMITFYTNATID